DRLSALHALFVPPLDAREPHVYLAPDLHHERMSLAAQPQPDLADRAQVRGYVFSDDAIAPRRSGDEDALAIRQADRGAIDLELARVARFADVVTGKPHEALLPLIELLDVERIRERQ